MTERELKERLEHRFYPYKFKAFDLGCGIYSMIIWGDYGLRIDNFHINSFENLCKYLKPKIDQFDEVTE